jgi:hypothetical protein
MVVYQCAGMNCAGRSRRLDGNGGWAMKWVTRERPKIDRIACPWLIARFIDQEPEFLYVPSDQVLKVAQETGAIPYDVPGVELSHVGELCSFDAFLRKYGLDEPELPELARIVRGADTGRLDLAPQVPGLLALSLGLSALCTDDHEMLRHGMVVYDALYAWLKEARDESHGWPPQAQPTSSPDAEVNEASKESFPASDPPSFTPVSGAGRPERA